MAPAAAILFPTESPALLKSLRMPQKRFVASPVFEILSSPLPEQANESGVLR